MAMVSLPPSLPPSLVCLQRRDADLLFAWITCAPACSEVLSMAEVCVTHCAALKVWHCHFPYIAKMKIAIITLAITIMCRKFDNKTLRNFDNFFLLFFFLQIGMLFHLF